MVGHAVRISQIKQEPPVYVFNHDRESDYADSGRESYGSTSSNSISVKRSESRSLSKEVEDIQGSSSGTQASRLGSSLSTTMSSLVPEDVKPDRYILDSKGKQRETETGAGWVGAVDTSTGQSSQSRESNTIVTPPSPHARMTDSSESRKHTLNVDDSSSEQLKRQKVDDLPRSRHWISGQMVVIQVDGAAFRLLSTQLEKESPFFSALFDTNVATASLDEMGTRIFVVDVNGVTKSNFAALLDVIEDPLKYFDSPPPFLHLLDIILVSYLLSFSRWHKWAIRQMEAFISTDVTKIDGTLRPFDQSLAALSVFRICKLRPFQKRVMYELVRRRDLFNDNDFLRFPLPCP
ncbi:hypothetical protein VKT23_017649 [Stygiomarasmius scandens]|uniref:BTB domain-containing protein n=1 Tax=Marasmiellus scandens TaxID=2682957 RepID=A0ABR1ITH6_9AGAR